MKFAGSGFRIRVLGVLSYIILLIPARSAAATIRYEISLAHKEQHMFSVTMTISDAPPGTLVALPAWNALYQIRDFAYRVRDVEAACVDENGQTTGKLPVNKLDKQTWRIGNPGAAGECAIAKRRVISYLIEWDDPGPFSTQLNAHHAFVNFPPERLQVPDLPGSAEEATRRPSFHVRAPRRRLQNLEGEKVLLHQYVRKVEHAVHRALAGWNTPLVLAAAEPLASMFRSVNSYPKLADEMIEGNPDLMTDAELEDAAIPILDRLFSRELKAVIALYDELKPERATTDVSYAAHAATAGAIEQLLVDFDAVVPGLVSDIDGSVIYSASDDAETYSVVNEVARRALFTGARVMGARREELPDRAPLTAILRYAFH